MSFTRRFLLNMAGGLLIWALGGTWVSSLVHHRPMDWEQVWFAAAMWLPIALSMAWMGHKASTPGA